MGHGIGALIETSESVTRINHWLIYSFQMGRGNGVTQTHLKAALRTGNMAVTLTLFS